MTAPIRIIPPIRTGLTNGFVPFATINTILRSYTSFGRNFNAEKNDREDDMCYLLSNNGILVIHSRVIVGVGKLNNTAQEVKHPFITMLDADKDISDHEKRIARIAYLAGYLAGVRLGE